MHNKYKSVLLSSVKVHPSFLELSDAIDNNILQIENRINIQNTSGYTPSPDKVLSFMSLDINRLKTVIIGMEPYPQPNIATGRAFEVGGASSWLQKIPQASLINILKLLYKDYSGVFTDIATVRDDIAHNRFKILPPSKLFISWEQQGVLLLNQSLTCKVNSIGSHVNLWKDTAKIITEYISTHNKNLSWFLWGEHAKKIRPNILYSNRIFESKHPSRININDELSFINSSCFKDTSDTICWKAYS